MKFLLGSLFAALLIVPFALSSKQDTITHCGKYKDGCECDKYKKKDHDHDDDKKDLLLA